MKSVNLEFDHDRFECPHCVFVHCHLDFCVAHEHVCFHAHVFLSVCVPLLCVCVCSFIQQCILLHDILFDMPCLPSLLLLLFSFSLLALPCPALPCPALPCPALPCPALPVLALPCPAPRCPALAWPGLPCPPTPLTLPASQSPPHQARVMGVPQWSTRV